MIEDLLKMGGIVSILILLMLVILLPIIATIIFGVYLANAMHLTGIVWWSFLILFYLIVMGIISLISK